MRQIIEHYSTFIKNIITLDIKYFRARNIILKDDRDSTLKINLYFTGEKEFFAKA